MKKNIKLHIVSERFDSSQESGNIGINTLIEALSGGSASIPDTNGDRIELITDAVVFSNKGKYEIKYDESEASGMPGSVTKILFDTETPDVLTMVRSGPADVTMVFSPGLRHRCTYNTGVFPIEMTVMTHLLQNRLTADGILKIDYTTELAGSGHALTRLTIKTC